MKLELIKQFTNAPTYYQNELPATIGNAIYSFGSNEIREIIAFIDTSEMKDGSKGMIITPTHLYNENGSIAFEEITSLKMNVEQTIAYINHQPICNYEVKPFLSFLSDQCDLTILLEGPVPKKIAYDLHLITSDLLSDVYEDIELTNDQKMKLYDLLEELNHIDTTSIEEEQTDCERLLVRYYPLFEELEIDSEEMDELETILKDIEQHQKQQEAAFESATHYYQDMVENLKRGDPKMYNQMKTMMKMIGISEEDLQGKTPEELDQMVEDLCKRYGISKSQVEAFAKRFQK